MVSNPVSFLFEGCGERTVMQSMPVQYTTEVIGWYEALAVGAAMMAAAARVDPARRAYCLFICLIGCLSLAVLAAAIAAIGPARVALLPQPVLVPVTAGVSNAKSVGFDGVEHEIAMRACPSAPRNRYLPHPHAQIGSPWSRRMSARANGPRLACRDTL
jgi:hypothetical protein